jgi:hypothetical protein
MRGRERGGRDRGKETYSSPSERVSDHFDDGSDERGEVEHLDEEIGHRDDV